MSNEGGREVVPGFLEYGSNDGVPSVDGGVVEGGPIPAPCGGYTPGWYAAGLVCGNCTTGCAWADETDRKTAINAAQPVFFTRFSTMGSSQVWLMDDIEGMWTKVGLIIKVPRPRQERSAPTESPKVPQVARLLASGPRKWQRSGVTHTSGAKRRAPARTTCKLDESASESKARSRTR